MCQLYLEYSGGCSVCQMFAVQTCQERSDCKYRYHGLYVMLSNPCVFDFLICHRHFNQSRNKLLFCDYFFPSVAYSMIS